MLNKKKVKIESLIDFKYFGRILNPCHTRGASLQRSHSVKKIAERRGARCANASNAVETLWKRCAVA